MATPSTASPTDLITWSIPEQLTHGNWQTAKAACVLEIKQAFALNLNKNINKNININTNTKNIFVLVLNWQNCKHFDSSALAFILSLRRDFQGLTIQHQAILEPLKQLAQLYEVNTLLGL